jgi:hypothetical protein
MTKVTNNETIVLGNTVVHKEKGTVSPEMARAKVIDLSSAPSLKKKKPSTLVAAEDLGKVIHAVQDVRKSLNESIKLLSQTKFERDCDVCEDLLRTIADLQERSDSLLKHVAKFKDKSLKIQHQRTSKPTVV